jgi:hypothetical protein
VGLTIGVVWQGLDSGASFVYLWAYAAMDQDVPLPYHLELTASWFSHDTSEKIPLEPLLRGAQWRHVTLTWSTTQSAVVYVDGSLELVIRLAGATHPLISGGVLTIGQSAASYDGISSPFYHSDSSLGQIDNFRVWDGVLSPSQVHDVVYMPKGRVSEYVADFNLLVWLTFDDDQTRSTLLDDNSTRVESVYDAESNVTAFGGCFGCSDLMLLASAPLLAVSDCPVITSSVLPARYSPHWPSTQDVTIPVLLRSEGECSRVSDSDGLDVWNGLEVSPSWNASTVIVGNVTLIRVLNESRNMMCEVLGGAVVTSQLVGLHTFAEDLAVIITDGVSVLNLSVVTSAATAPEPLEPVAISAPSGIFTTFDSGLVSPGMLLILSVNCFLVPLLFFPFMKSGSRFVTQTVPFRFLVRL